MNQVKRAKAGVTETIARLADAIGRRVDVTVDWDSFSACEDQHTAFEVLLEHALDRIAGAVEWMCEWDSCRRTLQSHLEGFSLSYSRTSKRMWCDHGKFCFEDDFSSDVGFPQANSCAQILDENLRLYEGRVYDIRHRIVPPYEARLLQACGHKVEVKLDLDNFSRLDWEGDDYYNAYTELTPANADNFFGRVARAFEAVFASGHDTSHIPNITMVKIKLSIKGHRRIKLRDGVLKLSERLWLGAEHGEGEIIDYLRQTFTPGADLQTWIDELRFELIPSYEDRISSLLGRGIIHRVPLVFNWKSFDRAEDPVAAIETVHVDQSAYILERVAKAIEHVISTHPSAKNTLQESLRAVRIEFCPSSEPHHQVCAVRAANDYDITGTEVRDRPVVQPQGMHDLLISACWELGAEHAPSVQKITDTLTKGFSLDDGSNNDIFQITYLKQTVDEAEVHGTIGSFEKFQTVFGMMSDYSKKSMKGFPAQARSSGPSSSPVAGRPSDVAQPAPRVPKNRIAYSGPPPPAQPAQPAQPPPAPAPAVAAVAPSAGVGVGAAVTHQSAPLDYANDLRDDGRRGRFSGERDTTVSHNSAYYQAAASRVEPSGSAGAVARDGGSNGGQGWNSYRREGGQEKWQVRLVSGPEKHAGTGHEITIRDGHALPNRAPLYNTGGLPGPTTARATSSVPSNSGYYPPNRRLTTGNAYQPGVPGAHAHNIINQPPASAAATASRGQYNGHQGHRMSHDPAMGYYQHDPYM